MVKIIECNEPLINLNKKYPQILTKKDIYVRKTVANMLFIADIFLPKDYQFFVSEGWRSKDTQDKYREQYKKRFQNSIKDQSELEKEVNRFVHPSKGLYASGHMTGGAIDVRLTKKGRKIPMESKKLTFQENAMTFNPKLPDYIWKNRKLQYNSLADFGFINNPDEYWHWSFGDVYWAQSYKFQDAIYGIVDSI